jgi:hypothetical protein
MLDPVAFGLNQENLAWIGGAPTRSSVRGSAV